MSYFTGQVHWMMPGIEQFIKSLYYVSSLKLDNGLLNQQKQIKKWDELLICWYLVQEFEELKFGFWYSKEIK